MILNTEKIKERIDNSPLFKTIIAFFGLVVLSILASTFISEISVDGLVKWQLFYKSFSFYVIIIIFSLIFLYNKISYNKEIPVDKFGDDTYCKAYMRRECLPELAKKANKLIKSGKTAEDIKSIIKELNL